MYKDTNIDGTEQILNITEENISSDKLQDNQIIFLIKENDLHIFETNNFESLLEEQNINQINVQNQDLLSELIDLFPTINKENFNLIIPLSTYLDETDTNLILVKNY